MNTRDRRLAERIARIIRTATYPVNPAYLARRTGAPREVVEQIAEDLVSEGRADVRISRRVTLDGNEYAQRRYVAPRRASVRIGETRKAETLRWSAGLGTIDDPLPPLSGETVEEIQARLVTRKRVA